MNLGDKLSGILDYKIDVTWETPIELKRALAAIVIFSIVIAASGYFVSKKIIWDNTKSVFGRKIEVLEHASETNNDSITKTDLALAYYLGGNAKEAEAVFKEILLQHKEDAVANIYYGLILADQQQYQEAISCLEKGISKDPDRETLAYLYLGQSYYYTGNLDKALENFITSVKLNRGSVLSRYYLGLCYQKQGKYQQAKDAFNMALKMTGGNYPEAKQKLAEIAAYTVD